MVNLYITSGETFSGKSAVCIGLGLHFRKDGLKVGYMKPVNINCQLCEGSAYDEDVIFAKQVFEMPEPVEIIGPVALTQGKFEQQLRGPEVDYEPTMVHAYQKIADNRDIIIMEGGRSLREGYVAGLHPKKVVNIFDAKVVMVLKFDEVLMIDRALTAKYYFGDTILGVIINGVPKARVDYVTDIVIPYLNRHQLPVFGAIRRDVVLAAPTVAELAEGLQAEVLCCKEGTSKLVENMLVGAMSSESALVYFRRKANKAVITGGDRADIQMAALETSTRCLILTGNLYPNPVVIRKAEEQGVPILLTSMDTLSAIEVSEKYFDRSRFQQPEKLDRFSELLDKYLDFNALDQALGIRV
ncbi:MAG: phosphotransacetylase family protein [Chloroflexi bacterium]|nr:MAG: phosphotransacetylase family protein [Chloroflexota bacterium]